jgi:hypothetical protein
MSACHGLEKGTLTATTTTTTATFAFLRPFQTLMYL